MPRQLLAQDFNVLRSRPVLALQLDLDVGILGADHAGVVVGEIDARDRHADVVGQGLDLIRRNDLANRLLHLGELIGGLLDPGADLGADMHQDLSGIDRGKEVAAEIRHQRERQRDHAQEAGDEHPAMPHRQRQQIAIAVAEPGEHAFERLLKAHQRIARRLPAREAVVMDVRLQQILGHRRHQRARQQERPGHREHHRFGHRHEQIARDALQEEHRHEHDADAQQRDEGRRHDLVGTVEDRWLDLLALLQMPIDVFDRHRGVVDQDADREREAAERHDVQRLADRRQADDGAEYRKRDRHCDDDRRSPAAQEQQDHHAGQQRRDHAFDGDAGDGAADEHRLVADQRDLQRLRHGIFDVDDLLLDAGNDIERRHRAGLQHHHQHRTVAVDMHDVGLRRVAVAHRGDVADVDHRAADSFDRQIAELLDLQRRVVELNDVFELADLLGADRGDQVLRGERVGDVLSRQSPRLQGAGIEVDLDLALLAAERPRDRRARHGHQRGAELIDREIGKTLFRHPLARQRQLQDRHGGGGVVQDQRRRGAGRHLLEQRLRDRGDLRIRGADVDIGLEENLDDPEPAIGVRHDVLDVVHRGGERALERRRDTSGHLIRRQAGVLPDDTDHRDTNFRENVGRRAERRQRTDDQQQQRQHHERVGPAQCDADQRDHSSGRPGLLVTERPPARRGPCVDLSKAAQLAKRRAARGNATNRWVAHC